MKRALILGMLAAVISAVILLLIGMVAISPNLLDSSVGEMQNFLTPLIPSR